MGGGAFIHCPCPLPFAFAHYIKTNGYFFQYFVGSSDSSSVQLLQSRYLLYFHTVVYCRFPSHDKNYKSCSHLYQETWMHGHGPLGRRGVQKQFFFFFFGGGGSCGLWIVSYFSSTINCPGQLFIKHFVFCFILQTI